MENKLSADGNISYSGILGIMRKCLNQSIKKKFMYFSRFFNHIFDWENQMFKLLNHNLMEHKKLPARWSQSNAKIHLLFWSQRNTEYQSTIWQCLMIAEEMNPDFPHFSADLLSAETSRGSLCTEPINEKLMESPLPRNTVTSHLNNHLSSHQGGSAERAPALESAQWVLWGGLTQWWF